MRVLVLGAGGREHALCEALTRSTSVEHVVCAPGNGGIAALVTVRPVLVTDIPAVRALVADERIDLVVVGPEAPLVAGVADALAGEVAVFGPTRQAARMESSKAFAKEVMNAAGVPSARFWSGQDPTAARASLEMFTPPYVVKADGLAAGKGVMICDERAEAERAVDACLLDRRFSDAGARIVVEEYLEGPEVSLFALCDGHAGVGFATAQDYKRALDGDQGLNTGGMGAYSPVPALGPERTSELVAMTVHPVLSELAARGTPYTGVLYAGLVLTADGPRVLEFNARFGDPETQAMLPRFNGDLGTLLHDAAAGRLAPGAYAGDWSQRACVTVVLASGGYPGAYEQAVPIQGVEAAESRTDVTVFHAGTARIGAGLVTAGGRVLAVSGLGDDHSTARATAYEAADRISFAGCHRRSDIARTPLQEVRA